MKKSHLSIALALVMSTFVSVCEAQTLDSVTVYSPTAMFLSVPYGYCNWSSSATFDFTGTIPTGSRILYIEFGSCSTQSASGAIAASVLRLTCGNWQADFNWYGGGGTTSVFAGFPVNVNCTTQFYACCNGTPYGGGSCSASIGGCRMTIYYY